MPNTNTEHGKKKLKKTSLKNDNVHDDFISLLGAPARRALENKGINTLQELSQFSEAEILALHGMGPSSIPKLKVALHSKGLTFRK
jgi:DNA-directed RNA polymerase alpha subunit